MVPSAEPSAETTNFEKSISPLSPSIVASARSIGTFFEPRSDSPAATLVIAMLPTESGRSSYWLTSIAQPLLAELYDGHLK